MLKVVSIDKSEVIRKDTCMIALIDFRLEFNQF